MLATLDLVCFDLPALVQPRPGTAQIALDRAMMRLGLEPGSAPFQRAHACDLRWPGRAARAALRATFGSEVWAEAAAAAFDDAFGAVVARNGAGFADGARAAVAHCRTRGAHVCLMTEFSASTREAILDVLDWSELVAMLLSEVSAADPEPAKAVSTAIERTGADTTRTTVVATSAASIAAARAVGVGCVVGVPGHGLSTSELKSAGAHRVCSLPQLASEWARVELVPV